MAARKVEQNGGYGAAVDAILDAMKDDHRPATDADWLPLALAALDQGGVSVADQARVRKIVEPYMRTSSIHRLSTVRFTVLHTMHSHVGVTLDSLIDAERYVVPSSGLKPDIILASDGRAWLRHGLLRNVVEPSYAWYMVEPSSLPHRFTHVEGRAIVSQFLAEHG
jgi:hypothetical protein